MTKTILTGLILMITLMVLVHLQFPGGVKIFKQSLWNELIGCYPEKPKQRCHTEQRNNSKLLSVVTVQVP